MLHPASKAHPASDDKAKAPKRKWRTKAEIAADRKAEEEAKAAQVMKKQAQIKQLAKLEEKLDEEDTNELTPWPNPSHLTYSGDRAVAGDDTLPQLDVGTKQKVPGQCQETDSDIDGSNHVNMKVVGREAIESGSEVQSLPDELDSEARDTTAEKPILDQRWLNVTLRRFNTHPRRKRKNQSEVQSRLSEMSCLVG
jgi:hypothetical protein